MPTAGRAALYAVLCCSTLAGACSGALLEPKYEYEEEVYLDLDGSATLNLNASVPALVALHGVDLPTDPRARLDRDTVRAIFARPGSEPTLSVSRRDGRRFVHVSLEVPDVRELSAVRPFSWSTYQFTRDNDRVDYQQAVGPPFANAPGGRPTSPGDTAGRPDAGRVGWDGDEIVAFRMHVPSEALFHNSATGVRRGNIVEWEQALSARLRGEPLDLRVQMAPESILQNTLLLFGSTVVAAVAVFAGAIWWLARFGRRSGGEGDRGRHGDVSERPA
jgi:hypothetical protein